MFIVSTYTEGTLPESAKWFCQWLSEAVDDFRVSKSLLSGLRFTVFGLGNSLYTQHYNTVAKNLFDWLSGLSGTSVYSLGLGDQNVAQSDHGGKCGLVNEWRSLCPVAIGGGTYQDILKSLAYTLYRW